MAETLVNGTSYGWANVQVVMLGGPVNGITKIDYKRTLKVENIYGAGQEPVSVGYGQYTYTASIEILTEEWRKISLASAGNPLSLPLFNISVLFLPSSNPGGNGIVIPYKDILYNCQFLEDGFGSSSGETSIKVTIPLNITGITRFGT